MKRSIILFLLMCIFLCSCNMEGAMVDTQQTDGGSSHPDSSVAEQPSKIQNPLITSEMWGDVPSEEEAERMYASVAHRRFDYYRYNRNTHYSRVETDSKNWILNNSEGQTLYCKDGILYGDMPYYRPNDMGVEVGYLYNYDALFVEYSERFTFIPADISTSELVVTLPPPGTTVNDDETVVWAYDNNYNAEASTTFGLCIELCSILKIPFEWGVFLRDGAGAQKIVVENGKIAVSGDSAYFSNVQVRGLEPFEIVFS